MKAIFWIGADTFWGTFIRVFKNSGISHCEILFSDGFSGTSYPGIGITLRPIPIDRENWVLIDIPCSADTEAKVKQFFFSEAGCKYDWVGLVLTQVFGFAFRSKSKWFCSEACVEALRPAIPSLNNVRPCSVDPARLAELLDECPELAKTSGPVG